MVDPTVETELVAAGINPASITRIAGNNRYETAMLIAQFIENYDMDDVDTAYFTTGENFPDALVAGPFGASFGRPILLVKRDQIPAPTQAAISGLALTTSYVLGGTAAVGNGVLSQLPNATRLGGIDRYETAVIIAEHGLSGGGSDVILYTATGQTFPDALSAAPLAATGPYPIILVKRDSVPATSMAYITAHRPGTTMWFVLGGEAAVGSAAVEQIFYILNP
ncbi:MAG: cell wall-binding repeat-containing protein [Coriobacteriia bacterium]|nr:cell wall-binding repeat-containing protein [Coriobacteriia bacterium]MBN2822293.1 cell wall-binding repeat-containing protein [Coriobacteriia bacterium]